LTLTHKSDARLAVTIARRLVLRLGILIRRRGKYRFIRELPSNAGLIDVGCGNNSPAICKALRSDVFYVGVDIKDYNQPSPATESADEYILVPRNRFWRQIASMEARFDAAISAHNLEHCDEPVQTLRAVLRSIKPGGSLYLSFPCEASMAFPRRSGTLNFYDDPTHLRCPRLADVLTMLESEHFQVDFLAERYRPSALVVLGLLLEPISAALRRTMPLGCTWALYGFETVIWARRRKAIGQVS
jgi:SAM-dependent methyltransferase